MAPRLDRRRLLWLSGAGLLGLALRAHGAQLPPARHLGAEIDLAARRGLPLVVMVSLHGCVYCERVRRSDLLPALEAGVPVVQVDMRSGQMLQDWQGNSLSHDQLVRRWQVRLAPTLLFLGPGGRELADRMEGSYQPDFYGAYLQARIDQARKRL